MFDIDVHDVLGVSYFIIHEIDFDIQLTDIFLHIFTTL